MSSWVQSVHRVLRPHFENHWCRISKALSRGEDSVHLLKGSVKGAVSLQRGEGLLEGGFMSCPPAMLGRGGPSQALSQGGTFHKGLKNCTCNISRQSTPNALTFANTQNVAFFPDLHVLLEHE